MKNKAPETELYFCSEPEKPGSAIPFALHALLKNNKAGLPQEM